MKAYIFILLITIGFSTNAQDTLMITEKLSALEREQFIQKAIQFRSEGLYLSAIESLDSIILRDPIDSGALLFKGDLLLQARKFKKAVKTYQVLLPLNFESTIVRINLSYALFLCHHPKKALNVAKTAWENDPTNINAVINYFNAQLWNLQTDEASDFLSKIDKQLDASQREVLQARLDMTNGEFMDGLSTYADLASDYPNKNFSKEYIDVLLARNQVEKAISVIQRDSALFNSSEYAGLLDKVNYTKADRIGMEVNLFRDIANNNRTSYEVFYSQNNAEKFPLKFALNQTSIISNQIEKTESNTLKMGVNQNWSPTLKGSSSLHLTQISPENNNSSLFVTGSQSIAYQPSDRRMYGIFIDSEVLDFTAKLYENKIRMTNLGYKTHIMFDAKSGFYSQGSFGSLSNDNNRLLFFGSVYHCLRMTPTLKIGLNFSALHFTNSLVTNYFSPNRYLNTECFTEFTSALPQSSRLYYSILVAVGMQQIERKDLEPVYRLQFEIGTHFKRLDAFFKYQTSNVASITGVGYQYDWLTFNLSFKVY